MQDAKRIKEQVDETTMKAEVRAAVAEDHRKIAVERRDLAERELAKFRALHESFTVGEQLLLQRRKQLLEQEQPPGIPVLEGIVMAVEQLQGLQKQAQEMVLKHEGAFMAFQAFEETFKQQGIQATSRARGMEVQGERAVDVAERREEAAPPAEGGEKIEKIEGDDASSQAEAPVVEEDDPPREDPPSVLDALGGADGESSAKEPMGPPRQKAGKKRSRRKPEP